MTTKRIALILLLLLLVAGCDKAKEIAPKKTTIEGSEGVVFEFYRNTPASEVWELQSLPLAFKIQNLGACDLLPVNSGTNPNRCIREGKALFALSWDNQVIGIPWDAKMKEINAEAQNDDLADTIRYITKEGDKPDKAGNPAFAMYLLGRNTLPGPAGTTSVTKGEERLLIFEAQARGINVLNPEIPGVKTQITAGLCYPYKTQIATDVCVDPDLFNLQEKEKTCEVILDQDFSTQGAPVAVTHMKTDMLPVQVHKTVPRFEFTVRNVGSGKVVAPASLHRACSFNTLRKTEDLNNITFRAFLGGDRSNPLKCGARGSQKTEIEAHLDRDSQQTIIICEAEEISQEIGTYETPLLIEVEYGYFDTQTEEINIKRVRRLP
jgi:hypothetical protein